MYLNYTISNGRDSHTEHYITFDKIDGFGESEADAQVNNMSDNATGSSANVSRRCFKAALPTLYEEPKYWAGDGEFIRYSRRVSGGSIAEKRMGEEEAAIWLWYLAANWPSEPALPGWQCPIEWVFSPVTGNKVWPGDLWGVDEKGELVIVEGKLGLRGDPFEDFLPPGLHRRKFTAEELCTKWRRHLDAELHGLSIYACSNSWEERPVGRTDGIIPRSRKRILNRRWRELTDVTRKRLESEEYQKRVERHLKARDKRKNPKPHFAGLHLLCPDKPPRPSMSECGRQLAQQVGEGHVHLYMAYAKRVKQSRARCCIELVC